LLQFATRSLLVVVVFAVTFQSACYVLALGVDGDVTHLARLLLREARRYQALQQRAKEMHKAEQLREATIEDLIAGRLTLAEAMEQFQQTQKLIQDNPEGLISHYRKLKSDKELCHLVCSWIESVLCTGHTRQEAKAVLLRLENELKERLPAEEIDQWLHTTHVPLLPAQRRRHEEHVS
jgi:hypothetical protein